MPDVFTLEMLQEVGVPVAIVLAGIAAGLFLEKVILRWLDILAERTEWEVDNIVFTSVRGVPVFWGAAVGIYLATLTLDVSDRVDEVLGKILIVAVLWSLTIIAARVAARLMSSYGSRRVTFLPQTSLIPGLTRLLIYVLGILIILGSLEISIAPFLATLGVGGLAVALALQNTLSNVFAGLYLIASGQIKPGNYVKLDTGDEGYTVDIDWRSTIMRTVLGNTVIIPNATMASSIVTNYSLHQREIQMRIPVAVDYESDLRHVEKVTLEVARETLKAVDPTLATFEPHLYFHTFGEFSLNMTVVLAVRDYFDQYRLRHEFMIRLIERYEAEGINIPFPIKEFEMELSTEGLDADRPGRLEKPSWQSDPAEEEGRSD